MAARAIRAAARSADIAMGFGPGTRRAAAVSMKPGDASDPSSYKVRRGKVGGWTDYVSEEQAEAIDHLVAETLSPVFGYR